MRVLAIDPSGNYQEGKGTTGLCRLIGGFVMGIDDISARDYDSAEHYWQAIIEYIGDFKPNVIVMEGFKLYKSSAQSQINSQFETPQLIGVIRYHCFNQRIDLRIQYASDVMKRWNDTILINLGHLNKDGKRLYWNGEITNDHKRDSMRHALHYWRYGRN